MASPYGIARYPGIESITEASYSLGHGITPGIASITMAPQSRAVAEFGTLRFEFGGGTLDFQGCRVIDGSAQRNGAGLTWQIQVADRRWRWAFGQISGAYNTRLDDGTIQAGTEKSPQELARLLLDAMNESGADVTGLPNDTQPEVEWDYSNPASALADLCEDLGCRVVLDLGGRVSIRLAGFGADLPEDGVMQAGASVNPPNKPDAITIVCAKNRYQCDFLLEAVGLDTDGTIKSIFELSYEPTAGWATADLPEFTSIADETIRDLARNTVFRLFRIRVPVEVPGGLTILDLRNILPIESVQVELVEDPQESTVAGRRVKRKRPRPAQVHGIWWNGTDDFSNTAKEMSPDPDDGAKVPRTKFNIDEERGLVHFDEAMIRFDPDDTERWAPARLVLRTAVSIRAPITRGWLRYERTRSFGTGGGTLPRYIGREDLWVSHAPQYTAGSYFKGESTSSPPYSKVTTGKDDVNRIADYYLDAAEAEYQATFPLTVTYAGLRLINPDGAIQQVMWSVGPGGATTQASRNTESHRRTLPYKERRRLERQRQTVDPRKQGTRAIAAALKKVQVP